MIEVTPISSVKFLKMLTSLNYTVCRDSGYGFEYDAAFATENDAREWIACQDYPSDYFIYQER